MQQPVINYQFSDLYAKQARALFTKKRYSFIEGSTKSGKTHACMEWLNYEAASNVSGRPRNYWWVAPISQQSKMVYRRYIAMLPEEVIAHTNEGKFIQFVNGSRIWFLSAEKPDGLYGDDVYAVVLDEASRMREEAFFAVRSTLTATGGKVRAIGNVKGRKNWFYKMCRRAEMGEANSHYAKLTAYDAVDAGIVKAEEIEDAKRLYPAYVFQQLYLAEAVDDMSNPFGIRNIQECSMDDYSWEPPVVFGWDLAKSVDWTVGIGLDKMGRVCRFERFQHSWLGTETQIMQVTGKIPAAIDSTGVGDPIVERLQRELAKQGNENIEGYKFTSLSKQQLIEGLVMAIQQKLIKFHGNDIMLELESFEYEITRTGVKYRAMEGMHDDCVCALALAWYKYKQLYGGAVVAPGIEWL